MAKDIDYLAKELGATVVGTVPDYSPGAFGMAALADILRDRLEPSVGKRPGRPSNPAWSKAKGANGTGDRAAPQRVRQPAKRGGRQVSPMQVAALILEQATASYFQPAAPRKQKRRSG